jgi:hypothetical protein
LTLRNSVNEVEIQCLFGGQSTTCHGDLGSDLETCVMYETGKTASCGIQTDCGFREAKRGDRGSYYYITSYC